MRSGVEPLLPVLALRLRFPGASGWLWLSPALVLLESLAAEEEPSL